MEDICSYYKYKKVLVTGHTGFKGAWLCLLLKLIGAKVFGYSLKPRYEYDLYNILDLGSDMVSYIDDIKDYSKLNSIINEVEPDIIFHLAAQALVIDSYLSPLDTINTNVNGTLNLLESLRNCDKPIIVVNVTTDKCYLNRDEQKIFVESDRLGGKDPYSASKAMVEILSNAYRESFFRNDNLVKLSTVRAGNVIGGGDWSENRIIPDCVRAIYKQEEIILRNPHATRPWQHVLDPISAYLLIALKMHSSNEFCDSWNIGPDYANCLSVLDLVKCFSEKWGGVKYSISKDAPIYKEAQTLMLDSSKAKHSLNWYPILNIKDSVNLTVDWYKKFLNEKHTIKNFTVNQIESVISKVSYTG